MGFFTALQDLGFSVGENALPVPEYEGVQGVGEKYEVASFAGGCFWCMEAAFDKFEGVVATVSGYTGGDEPDPTYRSVSANQTHHKEAVQVPTTLSFGLAGLLGSFLWYPAAARPVPVSDRL